jgi:hypothetical protein
VKKIPTLFIKQFDGRSYLGVSSDIHPGMEWVSEGKGTATMKIDGSAVAVIDGKLYRRYDAKHGKIPPMDAIPCVPEPDAVTGHWPHWLPVKSNDRWYIEATANTMVDDVPLIETMGGITFKTFEAIGKHFQSNPYGLENDILVPHGSVVLDVPRDFEGLRAYLSCHNIEGIVFWKDGEPQCKIRRKDFGFVWPVSPTSYLYPVKSDEKA